MPRTALLALAVTLTVGHPVAAASQSLHATLAVSVAGDSPETVVLLMGLVGGVAGFRRLEARLLAQQGRLAGVGHFPHEEALDAVVQHLLGPRAAIVRRHLQPSHP